MLAWDALSFTLLEASLSALGSVVLGVLLARVMIRRRIPFASSIESLLMMPFFLPPLSAVVAVASIYGRNGFGFDVFGLAGIVLTHMVLNIPIVFILLMAGYRQIPRETVQLAVSLDVVGRHIEWPLLRRVLPAAFGIVFLYAMLSFTVVLTLGGGPRTTTLEMAIYQAIRFDFDLRSAVSIAVLQSIIGVAIYLAIRRYVDAHAPNAHALERLPAPKGAVPMVLDIFALFFIGFIVLSPLFVIVTTGVIALPSLMATLGLSKFISALWSSTLLSVSTALTTVVLAWILIRLRASGVVWLLGAVSPLAIAVALILGLRIFVNPFQFGLPIVVFLQALAVMPLIMRIWHQALSAIGPEERQLLASIAPTRWKRFAVFWRYRLARPLVETLTLTLALSIGDLALLPLLAPAGYVNLPVLLWQMIGSYKFGAAAGLGFILLVMVFGILLFGRLITKRMEARIA